MQGEILIQDGRILTIIAPTGGTTKGIPLRYAAGVAKCWVPIKTVAAGKEVEVITTGVVRLPKAAALAINPGDACYWDYADQNVNKDVSGNFLLGNCAELTAADASFVRVLLA